MRPLVRQLAASLGAALAVGARAQTATPPLPPIPVRPSVTNLPATAASVPVPNVPAAAHDVSTPPVQALLTPATPAMPVSAPLCWDAIDKTVDVKPGEVAANFAFYVTNVSPAEVSIDSLSASCSCTVAKLPTQPGQPYKLPPGAFLKIDVTVDVRGKSGPISKSVAASTSAGVHFLTVRANIPPAPPDAASADRLLKVAAAERLLNQQIARADAKAVFQGDCARCHLAPAIGKTGEDLFKTACGVCHLAEHRAPMVPDLATLNIKVPINADYWRLWITYGKVGTLMPPWSHSQGGPLSAEQVESLAGYLAKRYPAKAAQN